MPAVATGCNSAQLCHKRVAQTPEQRAAYAAAKKARADAFAQKEAAAKDAAETVEVLEQRLAEVEGKLYSAMEETPETLELERQMKELKATIKAKKQAQPAQAASTTEADAARVGELLETLPKLMGDEIKAPVAELDALSARFRERISVLRQRAERSAEEEQELTLLGQLNRRILVGVRTAKAVAPERQRKHDEKVRRRGYLDATSNPEKALATEDKAWWKSRGQSVWNARKERAERAALLGKAGLPLPEDRAPLPAGETIDLAEVEGPDAAARAAAFNAKLQAAGLAAIEQMKKDNAEEKALLAPFVQPNKKPRKAK